MKFKKTGDNKKATISAYFPLLTSMMSPFSTHRLKDQSFFSMNCCTFSFNDGLMRTDVWTERASRGSFMRTL